ncbi:hypothetical protein H0H93_012905, partial [Arthromyces matolae]
IQRIEHPTNATPFDMNYWKLLSEQGAQDTLDFMQTYWVDYHGKNEHFWEHEWETHGVCMNTVQPKCLPDGSPEGAEMPQVKAIVMNRGKSGISPRTRFGPFGFIRH